MDKTLLLIALAWLCGVFFGMGLERKLSQRKRQPGKRDQGRPYPLPVEQVEADQRTNRPGKGRLYVVPTIENGDTFVIVRANRDVLASEPLGDFLCRAGKELQAGSPDSPVVIG